MATDDDGSARLAATLRAEREARGWSLGELGERSGVSKAMISRVERGEASPTAALLGRLSAAFGLTLSQLLARSEDDGVRLARAADQPTWTDPATGYDRRALSPPAGGPLELVEVELPPGAEVAYPPDAYAFIHQQVWVLSGTLELDDGEDHLTLHRGDCLVLGDPAARRFANRTERPTRYLVALARLR